MVPLKYLSNFWRILKISLVNCEINLQLKWSGKCILITRTAANQVSLFTIPDAKIYVSGVTLSTQDMPNCLNNYNQILKEQLTEININLKNKLNTKQIFRFFN